MPVDTDARDLGAERQVVGVLVVALEVTWPGLSSQGLSTLPLLAQMTFPHFQRVEGMGKALLVPISLDMCPHPPGPLGVTHFQANFSGSPLYP